MTSYALEFAFQDQSEAFSYGFICGRIWQQMMGDAPFKDVIPKSLLEETIAMATNRGWQLDHFDLGSEWLEICCYKEKQ